jgi:[protein-PII] uridylyltransferase
MQAQESKKRHTDAAARLQAGREELISRYPKLKTPDFLEKHAAIMDEYIRQRFETSMVGPSIGMVKNPYAFIALGGYGRMSTCCFSLRKLYRMRPKTLFAKSFTLCGILDWKSAMPHAH